MYYNASVEHAESGSQRYVDQLNVLWMVPPFVKFDSLLNADQLHHQSIDANQVFQVTGVHCDLPTRRHGGAISIDSKGLIIYYINFSWGFH